MNLSFLKFEKITNCVVSRPLTFQERMVHGMPIEQSFHGPTSFTLFNMFYTYVLKSQKDDKYYIGYSSDVHERLAQHNRGLVTSTKPRRPFDLVFYEAFTDQRHALRREKYFKTTKGKVALSKMLS